MKTFNSIKKSVVIVLASFFIACGAETLAAIVFIPAFAATWPVEGFEDYSIDLQPDGDNQGVESGVFEGKELDHPTDSNRQNNDLTGSFNGLNIEFTIERQNGNIQYTGRMIPISNENHNITRIELTSSEGDLVLSFD